MTVRVYYGDTSVRKQATYAKARLVVNTAATPCSYLNTNRQYLLCTKAQGAQKDGLPGAKFLLDFLASPCLGPAARKISQEKSGQSQQKQAADLAESSFTGLGKCGQTRSRFKVHFTLLQTDFNFVFFKICFWLI